MTPDFSQTKIKHTRGKSQSEKIHKNQFLRLKAGKDKKCSVPSNISICQVGRLYFKLFLVSTLGHFHGYGRSRCQNDSGECMKQVV